MAAHKSIMLRLSVRPAGKLSRCKHNQKHAIPKGELRFLVKEPGAGTGERGYCASCAQEMIEQAELDLAKLRKALS